MQTELFNFTKSDEFEEYHKKHPLIYHYFVKIAKQKIEAGRKKYGAKAIMEEVRWSIRDLGQKYSDYKINNDYTSRYVRKFEKDHPQYEGFFEKRQLKST